VTFLGLLIYVVNLYIRPQDWAAAVLNWRLELFIVGVTVAIGLVRYMGTSGEDARRLPVHVPFLAGWVVAILLSDVTNGNIDDGLSMAFEYAKRGVVFLMFWLALDRIWKVRVALGLMLVLAAVLGVQGIYQIQHGVGWAGQPMYWGGRIRWVGLWDGANVLSLVFVTAVPIALEMIFGPSKFWQRLLALVAVSLVFVGMFLAASRGAFIALGVVFICYFVRRLGKAGLLVGAVALVGALAVGPARMTHLDMDKSADGESASQRVDMWAEGLEMFKYNPVFGIGKGQFASYTGFLIAHNSFVQNMGETGGFGLFMWLGLIYLSFRCLNTVSRVEDRLSPALASITRAIYVSLVAYLATSFFISTDFEPLYILMAFSAICLDLARRELKEDLPVAIGTYDWFKIGGLECATVLGLYAITATLSQLT